MGVGKVIDETGCDCLGDRKRIELLWGDPIPSVSGGYEFCTIERCRACGKLWKWRYQSHPGTGRDHFRIPVGGKVGYMEFTHEEAAKVIDQEHRGIGGSSDG